jgi:hypothetical protein
VRLIKAQEGNFLAHLDGVLAQVDRIDGLRMTLDDGRMVQLRHSGNTPELRFYAEASISAVAIDTLAVGFMWLRAASTEGKHVPLSDVSWRASVPCLWFGRLNVLATAISPC